MQAPFSVRNFLPFCLAVALYGGVSGSAALAADNMGEQSSVAQPELAHEPLSIRSGNGTHQFSIEVAKTPKEQEIGEMFRTNIPADRGMLFVWPYPQQSDMWMKNTLCSLDIVFIGSDHRIQSIVEDTVPESLAHVSSHGPVIATLELRGGETARLGISVGDTVSVPSLDKRKS